MPDTKTHPFAVTEADSNSWQFQKTYIERLMDHSALTSAHPDTTLVLAGPPRFLAQEQEVSTFLDKLLPIGMISQMRISQNRGVNPTQGIGASRLFYTVNKAQGSASITRLLINGRNLLRALYTNAVTSGIDVTKFDAPAAFGDAKSQFFVNLDSELFLIPFGMAVFFRDKIHNEIGAFYMELCMVGDWSLGFAVGQSMIMENVNLLYDQLRPISTYAVGSNYSSTAYDPMNPTSDSDLFQAIFQATGVNPNPPATGTEDDTISHGENLSS